MADIRLKLTNCILQYSNDEGVTWTDVEGWSPTALTTCLAENIVAVVAPYTQEEVGSGQEPKCVATANTIAYFQNLINQVISILGAGGNFTQLLGGLGGLILIVAPGLGITILSGGMMLPFGAALIAVTGLLIANGSTGLAAAFTSGFWEELRCLLYCHADEGGQWDASATSSIRNEISLKSGIAWQITGLMIDILGAGGLTNTGRAGGVSSADCSGCDCPEECELFADTATTIPPLLNLDGTLTLDSPSTPNTPEGEYYGQYRLPYFNSCCRLEVVEITAFAFPTNAPFHYAGIRECDYSENIFTNFTPPTSTPPILPDLDGACFNAFYIRSSVPYEIKVRVIDCEDDGVWCKRFPFSGGQLDWQSWYYSENFGTSGWSVSNQTTDGNRGAAIKLAFDQIELTKVIVRFNQSGATGVGYATIWIVLDGIVLQRVDSSAFGVDTDSWPWEDLDGVTADEVWVGITTSTGFAYTGSGTITEVELQGIGTNPFGTDNC